MFGAGSPALAHDVTTLHYPRPSCNPKGVPRIHFIEDEEEPNEERYTAATEKTVHEKGGDSVI